MSGTSLVDLLVAMALVLLLAAGVTRVVHDGANILTMFPVAADLAQRVRAVRAALERDVGVAGAGPVRLPAAAPLVAWVPPVWPRRVGTDAADPETEAYSDRLTLLTVPDGAAESLLEAMVSAEAALVPSAGPWCPPVALTCGFRSDRALFVFDDLARVDVTRALAILPGVVQPEAPLSTAYGAGAVLTEGYLVSYRYDPARRQIRRALVSGRELPLVDEVVGFHIEYLGDPFPPRGPVPPAGEDNCVIDRDGRSRLPVLAPDAGALVRLTAAALADGPWCGAPPFRFDADLFRVRRIRFRVRFQADAPAARGRDPARFRHPGVAVDPTAEVPDVEVVLDVAPKNLQRL
jgi:hypothetical protein